MTNLAIGEDFTTLQPQPEDVLKNDVPPVVIEPAPADIKPEPVELVAGTAVLEPIFADDVFVSYKLIDGSVDLAVQYYNEQMLIHGHPSNWADSLGLQFVDATQLPNTAVVRVTCKMKE